ncbi:hypothetical protein FZC84_21220 [Rossellomorea vietnamensis]|uniref:Phage head morphogenesis domain-containing protein n=1 Tax=Rossellomorea vietnamensis TaxID=218284 RepID=A0A5D4M253_9BACI|nr:hypothetical protein [Rossellomorea vietnamensis]TYR95716.1 hypothetical protein FZC84_21220 [Rossellomorea vietnamensis]
MPTLTPMEEWMEKKDSERIKREKAFVGSLAPLYKEQRDKEAGIVKSLYTDLSNREGLLEKQELYKYGRDKKIKDQIKAIHKETGKKEIALLRSELLREMEEEQFETLFLLYVMGSNVKKTPLSKKDIQKLLKETHLDETFLQTIARHKNEQTASTFNKILTASIQGFTIKQAVDEVSKTAKTGLNKSVLHYQTEVSHKKGVVNSKVFVRYGVEKYQWIAALSERTCQVCGGRDKQVFSEGVYSTPAHPRCRCTIIPYFTQRSLRRARDPQTNKNYLVDDISFNQWKNTLTT